MTHFTDFSNLTSLFSPHKLEHNNNALKIITKCFILFCFKFVCTKVSAIFHEVSLILCAFCALFYLNRKEL